MATKHFPSNLLTHRTPVSKITHAPNIKTQQPLSKISLSQKSFKHIADIANPSLRDIELLSNLSLILVYSSQIANPFGIYLSLSLSEFFQTHRKPLSQIPNIWLVNLSLSLQLTNWRFSHLEVRVLARLLQKLSLGSGNWGKFLVWIITFVVVSPLNELH